VPQPFKKKIFPACAPPLLVPLRSQIGGLPQFFVFFLLSFHVPFPQRSCVRGGDRHLFPVKFFFVFFQATFRVHLLFLSPGARILEESRLDVYPVTPLLHICKVEATVDSRGPFYLGDFSPVLTALSFFLRNRFRALVSAAFSLNNVSTRVYGLIVSCSQRGRRPLPIYAPGVFFFSPPSPPPPFGKNSGPEMEEFGTPFLPA